MTFQQPERDVIVGEVVDSHDEPAEQPLDVEADFVLTDKDTVLTIRIPGVEISARIDRSEEAAFHFHVLASAYGELSQRALAAAAEGDVVQEDIDDLDAEEVHDG